MPLDRYQEKRDFTRTPEPEGGVSQSESLSFVIQKHAASRLHYDVRLEFDGVLMSWAVPKGPSLDPHDKRLAVHVEDHPLDYASFEGTIPKGEYGGGTVMVWDRGSWEPIGDPATGLAKGDLKFELHGEKLLGRWVLVRMKPRPGDRAENWLLIKERDDYVRPAEEYDVVKARPESALSGRDMDQIAAGESAPERPLPAEAGAPAPAPDPGSCKGAVLGELPLDAPVQLATLVGQPPEGKRWLHEIKYDGYRLRCITQDGTARLLTRNGHDWSDRFEGLTRAAAGLPVSSAMLDGEAVALGRDGVPDFGALQAAIAAKSTASVTYMAFDLLYLDGWDLRGVELRERKELLRELLGRLPESSPLRYADHVEAGGTAFHARACTMALEGSVSKLADRPYAGGRSRDWLKVKCLHRQEFVVAGYTAGKGSRTGFGALLLGAHGPDGVLRYAGRVGTGFSLRELATIRARLDAITVAGPPHEGFTSKAADAVTWVLPELVAEVSFQEWTRDGLVRQASFHGIREDKPAKEVAAEVPEAPGASERVTVGGVAISNPGKVLYRTGSLTKLDLARYYEQVAEWMLPHVADRPLTLVRCPHGRERDCFYQKHPDSRGFPDTLHTTDIVERGGPSEYFYVTSVGGLVSLAQLGALEIHAWNSRVSDPERPDRIVFDLDPGHGVAWVDTVYAARLVRDALGALGLGSFVKTTGGKGLHVIAPLVPEHGYDVVRSFARALVEQIVAHDPGAFTGKMAKSERPGRVFIDYLRNAHGATAVCAYSTRARDGAPVSMPLAWEELTDDLDPLGFDTASVPKRLRSSASAPWKGYENAASRLGGEVLAALGIPVQGRLNTGGKS